MIQVGSADIMATLLLLKAEIEGRKGSTMRMVFADATEAHLLAKEIGMCCLLSIPATRKSHSFRRGERGCYTESCSAIPFDLG